MFLLDTCSSEGLRLDASANGTVTMNGYSNKMSCRWSIEAPQGAVVVVTFLSLSTECGWDFVQGYDGAPIASQKLFSLSGCPVERPTFISSEPQMTVLFNSDMAVSSDGFSFTYSTLPDCPSACIFDSKCTPSLCECTRDPADGSVSCVASVTAAAATTVSGRAQHVVAYDAENDLLYSFGGYSFSAPFSHNLNVYSFATGEWSLLDGSSSPWPSFRHSHTGVFYAGCLYIFGGLTPTGESRELWTFCAGRWSLMVNKGEQVPPGMYGHAMVLVEDEPALYVFGGYSSVFGYSSKLYRYDLVTLEWEKIVPTGSQLQPPALYGHAMVYHPETASIYVHGGLRYTPATGSVLVTNDLLRYSVGRRTWATLMSDGDASVERAFHRAIAYKHNIVFFGGSLPHSDGFTVDTQCIFGDSFMYDVTCGVWRESPIAGDLPSARSGAGMVVRGDTVVFFGGFDARPRVDIVTSSLGPVGALLPSCLASFCAQSSSCTECSAYEYCGFCNGTCLVSAEYGSRRTPTNATCSTASPPPCLVAAGCYQSRSCSSCTADTECAWCDGSSACVPQTATSAMRCNTGWDLGTCPRQLCDALSSCRECIREGGDSLAECRWCSSSASCISSADGPRCSTIGSLVDTSAQCPAPCTSLRSAPLCNQASECMWCESPSQCIDQTAYLATFFYGQCRAWSLNDIIEIDAPVMRTVAANKHIAFDLSFAGSPMDLLVVVETPPGSASVLHISLINVDLQVSWRTNGARLVVRASDTRRVAGNYFLQVDNPHTTDVLVQLTVSLSPPGTFTEPSPTPTTPSGNFDVVYFIAFFFLFLMSLISAVIVAKKLRDIVRLNRARRERKRMEMTRVIPPIHRVNLLDDQGKLITWQPGMRKMPIALSPLEGQAGLALVSFLVRVPGGQDDDEMPPLAIMSTVCRVEDAPIESEHVATKTQRKRRM